MPYPSLTFTVDRHVAQIVLDRPEAGNAIDLEMAQALDEVCRGITQDDNVYVVLMTGSGGAFCTGSQLKPGESRFSPAASVADIDRPVIIAINGDALAEGLELALAGDLRIASEAAHFGLPQIVSGRMPICGGTQRLPRFIGPRRALEMMLTGDAIDAREALSIGLVNRVVPPERLAAAAEAIALAMAAKGPIALRYIKEAVNKGSDLTLEQGLRLEADLYFLLQTTADRTEGIRAFLEKREPRFKGE